MPVGTLTGYVAGAGLVTLLTAFLSQDAMRSWGWRIPFLLSAGIGMVGLYIRLKLEETPVYQETEEQEPARRAEPAGAGAGGGAAQGQLRRTFDQFRRVVVEQWRPLLLIIGLVMVVSVATYTLTYLPTYLKAIVGMGNTKALLIVLVVLAILVATVTFSARLSDRIGRRPIMLAGCAWLLVSPVPAFILMQTGATFLVFVGVLMVGVMLLCFTAVEPATLPPMFPTRLRGLSVSIGYNASVTIFGGTTPLIIQALLTATVSELVPAYYMMGAGVIGAVAVYLVREPAGKRLPGARPAAESEEEARQMAREREEAGYEPQEQDDPELEEPEQRGASEER